LPLPDLFATATLPSLVREEAVLTFMCIGGPVENRTPASAVQAQRSTTITTGP
jgi:hypothetical protein